MNVIILIFLFLVIWLFTSNAFDRVIEYQYKNYHAIWVKDGRPRGMFFHPKGSSVLSFWYVSLKGWKEIPEWAKSDNVAISLFNEYFFWKKVNNRYAIAFIPLLILTSLIW